MPFFPKADLASNFPLCDKAAVDLLKKMLVYNPEERIDAEEALQHAFFQASSS